MTRPFFYDASIQLTDTVFTLNEETSKHVVQVLRMQKDTPLNLTNGRGDLLMATIVDAHKKHCQVSITNGQHLAATAAKTTIAMSILKNTHRFEWFVEKATEMGVDEIIPLLCHRTEKQHFRYDRIKQISISAMLQSQQSWLPQLQYPTPLETVMASAVADIKWMAHCSNTADKKALAAYQISRAASKIILIGPEGDFSAAEIELACRQQFLPVSLGNTRLRTETAGVVAAAVLTQV